MITLKNRAVAARTTCRSIHTQLKLNVELLTQHEQYDDSMVKQLRGKIKEIQREYYDALDVLYSLYQEEHDEQDRAD